MGRPREIADEYFKQNPNELIRGDFGKIASSMGISYDTVRRAANELKVKELVTVVDKNRNSNERQHLNVNTKSQTDVDYASPSNLTDEDKSSLESYCKSYGIPYEFVTSAKFVNHNGQEAWNVFCDFEAITPIYLDTYLEDLKSALTDVLEPVMLNKTESTNLAAYHNYIADAHVGASSKSNDTYDNKYDAEIFEARLLSTLENYIEEAGTRGKFDKFLHVDLGDSVNSYMGKTTRGLTGASKHTLHENMNTPEIFDVYVRSLRKYFDKIVELDLAENIEFIAISNDNHGGAFSYIVNRAVEIYLNIKYPEIATTIERKFISQYEYGIHHFLFTHGKDEEEMKFGFPLNLNEKVTSWLYQFLRKKNINSSNVHIIKGDLHQENQNLHETLRYRNCLSLYGANSWSMLNFGFTPAGHSYEVVYKDRKKIVSGHNTF